jgi:hypothetical protein
MPARQDLQVGASLPPAGRGGLSIPEGLLFAGHPMIGAAAALHERHAIKPAQSCVCVVGGPVAPLAHGLVDSRPSTDRS